MPDPNFGKAFLDHLETIVAGDTVPDRDIVDGFRRMLPVSGITQTERTGLAFKLYEILPAVHGDATPLVELITVLLQGCPLDDILSIEPPVDLAAGLDAGTPLFHSLTLSILQKGISDLESARRLAATRPEIFPALLRLLFCTETTATASLCQTVIVGYLLRDRGNLGAISVPPLSDQSTINNPSINRPVWRRVFQDPDVYDVFYNATSSKHSTIPMSRNRRTVAQARLLEVISEIAHVDWTEWAGSHIPEIESRYDLQQRQGLLHYATLHMIATEEDVLMHRSLLEFFGQLLKKCAVSHQAMTASNASRALDYLIATGNHARLIQLYTQPDHPAQDPTDIIFLYPAAAAYVEAYCTLNPHHIAQSTDTINAIVARLRTVLAVSPSRWQSSPPSAADLAVLVALPARVILAHPTAHELLSYLPVRTPTVEVLIVLTHLCSGFRGAHHAGSLQRTRQTADIIAHRSIYHEVLREHPLLWQEIVKAAEVVALKDTALAAIDFIDKISDAWQETHGHDSQVNGFQSHQGSNSPLTGIEAIISAPAVSAVLPYLLRPPQTYSNLVGGRGDAENSAYEIATAKFDCTEKILRRLVAWTSGGGSRVESRREELTGIENALTQRLKEGVWGSQSGIGGRIATLEL